MLFRLYLMDKMVVSVDLYVSAQPVVAPATPAVQPTIPTPAPMQIVAPAALLIPQHIHSQTSYLAQCLKVQRDVLTDGRCWVRKVYMC